MKPRIKQGSDLKETASYKPRRTFSKVAFFKTHPSLLASPQSQDSEKFHLKVANLTWHQPSPVIFVLDVNVADYTIAMSCTIERTSSLMLMVMDFAFNLQSKIDG